MSLLALARDQDERMANIVLAAERHFGKEAVAAGLRVGR